MRRRARATAARLAMLAILAVAPAAAGGTPGERVLDECDDPAAWRAAPSDGVSLALATAPGVDGGALRLDFDFHGGGGWAAARRPLDLELPANWELTFWLRGETPPENFEIKLVAPGAEGGENVWWVNRRNYEFPTEWRRVRVKRRQVEFAWGPAGGGEPGRIGAFEIAITAGSGGVGSIWIDRVALRELPPERPYAGAPVASASSAAAGEGPKRALDGDPATAWRSAPPGRGEAAPWLAIDFGEAREFGGLMLDWAGDAYATAYDVEVSDDGERWRKVRAVTSGNGGRDVLALPESESRFVRLRLHGPGPRGFAVAEVRVEPLAFSASANALFQAMAADARRGDYSRYLAGEQSYWTVVGADGDGAEALLGEDGAVEPFAGGFSIEPFVKIGGELVTWADVETEHTLADGYLPIPTATWLHPAFRLDVTAFAAGDAGRSVLVVRYRLSGPGGDPPPPARLLLAIRPLQVNPPTQFLGTPGGAATVRSLAWQDGRVRVDGGREVVPLTPPAGFGAVPFDGGPLVDLLRKGELPAAAAVDDPQGFAAGALAYDLAPPPGGSDDVAEVIVAVPFHAEAGADLPAPGDGARAWAEERQAAVAAAWRERLNRVGFTVPAAAQPLIDTLRSNLAYVLVNRAGPALQPGARAYARSWIRDGALTSAALLRLGHAAEARAFVEWFAGYQYPSGKVPCCVDRRGADPVPEHDSAGELLFAVAEVFRFTGDHDFARRMWPHVEGAVRYLEALRAERTTAEYREPDKLATFGLLPESISHEGYSDRPVHSYWDDFWALRGLKDAAWLAAELGAEAEAARWAALRDAFAADLYASLGHTMAMHGIGYLPGSVEKGDFDATSTTIALAPGGELGRLPEPQLHATFERYWTQFLRRRDPCQALEGDAYTPYELRSVGAFVRLGWRERAHELLAFFLADRRPAGWNQWAEVVGRDPRAPRFIGDMPHTWVGSDGIRSILDLFAYEREADGALVVAAGIPAGWLAGGERVGIRGLPTRWGWLTYRLERTAGRLTARIEALAPISKVPPGGVVLDLPREPGPPPRVWIDGAPAPAAAMAADGTIRLSRLPATVEIGPGEGR